VDVPPPVVSGRALLLTAAAVGAGIGLAYATRRRHGAHDEVPSRVSESGERVQTIAVSDELALERSSELSALDGGYDVTAAATPSTIDLR